MTKKKFFKGLGGLILSLGILLGFFICSLIVWGDLEATLFTNGMNGERRIGNLQCPVLITSHETGTISVVVNNPADRDSDRFLRASISEGYSTLVRESKEKVPLPAKGKKKVEWKIYPEDAAYERIVLFRLYIPSKYPYPSMSGSCGVIKIDLPWLSGNQALAGLSLLGVLFITSGAFILERSFQSEPVALPNQTRTWLNGIYALAGILSISSILSYLGLWLLGVFGLAAAVILACATILRR